MKLKLPSLGGLPKPEKKLTKVPGAPKPPEATTASNPMKVGDQATVKTPKAKKMADPFGKPSLFFKSEDFGSIKKPSIEKLRSFLEKTRTKR
jgi:hypothetical protein